MVGNYYDAGTDYTGAQATARLLPNSRLLSYAGWGHTAYGRTDCITAHIDHYLLTGTPPPAGTVCPAGPNPFTPVADRRATLRMLIGLPPSRPGSRGVNRPRIRQPTSTVTTRQP